MAGSQDSVVLFCPIGEARHHAALEETCRYTRVGGASVELFAVLHGPSAWDRLVHHEHAVALEAQLSAAWRKTFRRWENEFSPVIRTEVRLGAAAKEIIERAEDIGAELVVLSVSDDHADRATATRIMRLSPVPVWVVRPTRAKHRRIMVAVNPEPEEAELNRALMRWADRLHRHLGGTLTLMAAWELYGEATMRQSTFFTTTASEFDDLYSRREGITRRGLEELVVSADHPEAWSVHLAKGPPAPTILRAAQQLRVNLVVLGTVGRSGLMGLLMGNTAEDVLDVARCSSLTMTPTAALAEDTPRRTVASQ